MLKTFVVSTLGSAATLCCVGLFVSLVLTWERGPGGPFTLPLDPTLALVLAISLASMMIGAACALSKVE